MRTTSRWFIGTVFIVGVFSFCVPAQSAGADITGDYSGSYDGPQGTTRFTLSVTEQEGRASLTGVLTSRVGSGADAVVSTNQLTGRRRTSRWWASSPRCHRPRTDCRQARRCSGD